MDCKASVHSFAGVTPYYFVLAVNSA